MRKFAVVSVVLTVMAAGSAHPALAQMPDYLQRQIEPLGNSNSPALTQATLRLYAQELNRASSAGAKVTHDQAYGSDRLQKLDLHQPEGKSGVPVVVFVHGGGFVGGDKAPGPKFWGNVPTYFARNGLLAASMNYRLAPGAKWPAAAQDVGAAVQWLKAHAGQYGGDPQRIFLFGYSAGATHVASYVFDPSLQPPGGSGVAGAVLVSGLYQAHPTWVRQVAEGVNAYFGDESQLASRSPYAHAPENRVPLFLAGAENDLPSLVLDRAALKEALCASPAGCPAFLVLPHHNHISIAAAFNTADEQLGKAILAFIRGER